VIRLTDPRPPAFSDGPTTCPDPWAEHLDQLSAQLQDHVIDGLVAALKATKIVYATRKGRVTDQREVPDWRTRRIALKLVLRVQGVLPIGPLPGRAPQNRRRRRR
jgi:hypothetical protein